MEKKRTYSQDWKSYNYAQINEGRIFMRILSDVCSNISDQNYRFGRPSLPMSYMIFTSALKVYSTFSLRRFMSSMKIAKEKGYIEKLCSYSTISNYMRKPEMTKALYELIKLTSEPLASIENNFAADSSGFSSSRFDRYFSFKHGKRIIHRPWIKAHIMVGVKTNIVTAVELGNEYSSDSKRFEPLVRRTAETFQIVEVTGDKAYSSRKNLDVVDEFGGKAYIPFKSNATGRSRGSPLWRKMYHYFMMNRDEFMEHYHKRSNVETTFHMIKSKFGDSLRSRRRTSQINEVLLKILCHNICVIIQEMFELGIDANFGNSFYDEVQSNNSELMP